MGSTAKTEMQMEALEKFEQEASDATQVILLTALLALMVGDVEAAKELTDKGEELVNMRAAAMRAMGIEVPMLATELPTTSTILH